MYKGKDATVHCDMTSWIVSNFPTPYFENESWKYVTPSVALDAE